MGKKLLLTEKPSVAMEFAKAIGEKNQRKNGYLESENWIITWCVGHLVTMCYPEKYDEKLKYWRLDTLPFIPNQWKYEIIPAVENQFNIIRDLMQRNDVEEIYNAGDAGREGEYIQRLVIMMAKPNPNVKYRRVWIDSQTEEEIRRGIKEAKDMAEYDSLSDSAYLRAKEDYLIGINFSRMLSIIYGNRLAEKINQDRVSISVGRVMTCVLGMIVNREREIKNFIRKDFYKIEADFSIFKAEWKVSESSKLWQSPKLYNDNGFNKKSDANDFIEYLADKKAIVESVKRSKQKEKAPLLFNLAEIQNECTRRFKIKPDETLEMIQNLYEKKLVTYPRTDARVLSSAVAKVISNNLNGIAIGYKNNEIQRILKRMKDEKYSTNLIKTKYVNDKKITDHYAIIPTGKGYENLEKLPEIQKRIYELIVRRFLAIFYPPAEYSKMNIVVSVENEMFFASAKQCLSRGYLDVWKKSTVSEKNVENDLMEKLNIKIKKGDVLQDKKFIIKKSETSPPARYNSGTLILAMENAGKLIEDEALREQIKGAGIGTSATRGEIIKKLEKIKYISINSKTQIVTPTQKGEYIYDIVNGSIPDLLNPKLTASWEKGLDMVAKKQIQADEFMKKLTNYINQKFDKLVVRY